jgi:NAD(P) transhydrogenase subunit alpha
MDISISAAAITAKVEEMLSHIDYLTNKLHVIKYIASNILQQGSSGESFLQYFTIFVLACFVGYYVVWNVSPALHSPLMAITNAISSVIIIGALIAASSFNFVSFVSIILTSINIFGGFIITYRMSLMFKRKKSKMLNEVHE